MPNASEFQSQAGTSCSSCRVCAYVLVGQGTSLLSKNERHGRSVLFPAPYSNVGIIFTVLRTGSYESSIPSIDGE